MKELCITKSLKKNNLKKESRIMINQGEIRESLSTYLFCVPSFLSGFARILDLGATFNDYNESNTTIKADFNALYSDWLMTGKDIENSIENIKAKFDRNISQ